MALRAFLLTPLLVSLAPGLAGVHGGGPKPGVDGTVTSYEADRKTVILVESCSPVEGKTDEYDYKPCYRVLAEKTISKLCKRGAGTYKWALQIGSEKSLLMQSTTCR
jgi:hypothetical protein